MVEGSSEAEIEKGAGLILCFGRIMCNNFVHRCCPCADGGTVIMPQFTVDWDTVKHRRDQRGFVI